VLQLPGWSQLPLQLLQGAQAHEQLGSIDQHEDFKRLRKSVQSQAGEIEAPTAATRPVARSNPAVPDLALHTTDDVHSRQVPSVILPVGPASAPQIQAPMPAPANPAPNPGPTPAGVNSAATDGLNLSKLAAGRPIYRISAHTVVRCAAVL
jgi:hypothetical protein